MKKLLGTLTGTIFGAASLTHAQTMPRGGSAVRGVVSVRGALPLAGALVVRGGLVPDSVRSDSAGRFVIQGLTPGRHTFTVRHMGFEPVGFEILFYSDTTVVVDVPLEPRIVALDTLGIVGDRALGAYDRKLTSVGFEERRRQAERSATDATFLTPQDIDRRKPSRLSHLLEGQRSVHVQSVSNGWGAIARGRDNRCLMTVWVDGQLFYPTPGRLVSGGGLSGMFTASPPGPSLTMGGGDDLGVNGIAINDVAAVEIYPSPSGTPPQFQSLSGTCGAIVIWTKQ